MKKNGFELNVISHQWMSNRYKKKEVMEKRDIRNSMNVLYLCEGSTFAGVESYALNLLKKIAYYNDMKCFVATFYGGRLIQLLKTEPVNLITLYGKNNLNSILHIVKYAKLSKINIIHCIDFKSTIVGGIASIFLKNVKIVSTVHGLPEHYKGFGKQLRYIVSLTIFFLLLRYIFDGIIFVSYDLKERLCKIIGSKKYKVIHNGIMLNVSSDCSKFPGNDQFIIGTVGRLDTVKGHIYLLEAAQMLLAERNDVVFHIIGIGPLEEKLKKFSMKLGIADNVRFLGFKTNIKSLMSGMDIFVLTSIHEGIPYVLLEAMASSLPVICTNVGGIKEIVKNLHDGILISSRDSYSLYKSFKVLLTKEKFRKFLGTNANKKIFEKFSSDSMASKTNQFYKEIMNIGK